MLYQSKMSIWLPMSNPPTTHQRTIKIKPWGLSRSLTPGFAEFEILSPTMKKMQFFIIQNTKKLVETSCSFFWWLLMSNSSTIHQRNIEIKIKPWGLLNIFWHLDKWGFTIVAFLINNKNKVCGDSHWTFEDCKLAVDWTTIDNVRGIVHRRERNHLWIQFFKILSDKGCE